MCASEVLDNRGTVLKEVKTKLDELYALRDAFDETNSASLHTQLDLGVKEILRQLDGYSWGTSTGNFFWPLHGNHWSTCSSNLTRPLS